MSRDLAVLRMRRARHAVLHVLAFAWFTTHYDGRPLARLPFVPFEFVQKLSRRGLTTANPGVDHFLSLCMMSLRPNLQKALGFAPPSMARTRCTWRSRCRRNWGTTIRKTCILTQTRTAP